MTDNDLELVGGCVANMRDCKYHCLKVICKCNRGVIHDFLGGVSFRDFIFIF